MAIDLKKLTWLPCFMIFIITVHMCMSLSEAGSVMISYMVLGLELLSFAFMLFVYFRKGELSRFVLLFIIYQLLLFTVTIVNGADIKNCFYYGCEIMLILMLMDYYKDRFNMVLFSFAAAFSFCVFAGLYHMLQHPELWFIQEEKFNSGYLLGGNYNQIGCRLICAIATNVVCSRINKWWYLVTIPTVIASIAMLTIVQSMTSITSILLFFAICLIPSKSLKKIGVAAIFVFVFLFQVFVCFNGKGIERNEMAVYFVEDILHKDITFTMRTTVWEEASKTVATSPIFGHGMVDGDWFLSHMYAEATGPHNFFYSVLIFGGILLFALFLFILFYALKETAFTSKEAPIIITAAIAVFLMMSLMEMYPYAFVFYLIGLAYYSSYIKKEGEEDLSPALPEENDGVEGVELMTEPENYTQES